MARRLTVLVALAGLACGGGAKPAPPAPQTINEVLDGFLAAVKANDLTRMGQLWGTTRGPAADWMKADDLTKRLTVIQRYLDFRGYRIVEGPLAVAGSDERRLFRVELQHECTRVQPIEMVRTHRGNWLVADVHLESALIPNAPCPPKGNAP